MSVSRLQGRGTKYSVMPRNGAHSSAGVQKGYLRYGGRGLSLGQQNQHDFFPPLLSSVCLIYLISRVAYFGIGYLGVRYFGVDVKVRCAEVGCVGVRCIGVKCL